MHAHPEIWLDFEVFVPETFVERSSSYLEFSYISFHKNSSGSLLKLSVDEVFRGRTRYGYVLDSFRFKLTSFIILINMRCFLNVTMCGRKQ